jgi:hypothetical protein
VLSWDEFAAQTPDLACEGRRLLAPERGPAFLATVRGADAPRVHAIEIGFADGRLYGFIVGAKRRDLEVDGRYALHAPLDQEHPDEFLVRGRVRAVTDPQERSAVAAGWSFSPGDEFLLVEFLVESALAGHRATRDDWPPRYTAFTTAAAIALAGQHGRAV